MAHKSLSFDFSPEMQRQAAELLVVLGPERLALLVRLLHEVQADTGFGDVKIVVCAGRVERIKVERSY